MNAHETGRPDDPKLLTDPNETRLAIATWRAEIITNILATGILARSDLLQRGASQISSSDVEPRDRAYGWYLVPAERLKPTSNGSLVHDSYFIPREIFTQALYGGVYGDADGILPVVCERSGEPPIEIFSLEPFLRRGTSSFLVVCEPENRNISRFYMGTRELVTPSSFKYLVFPENTLQQIPEVNTSIPIKTTSRLLTRIIGLKQLQVPDYEEPLNAIVDELGYPIWVHGVRLPTEEDLAKLATLVPQSTD